MKAFLVSLLVALLLSARAESLPGSIFGHSEADARARYGEPVKVTPAPAPGEGRALCFERDGIYITLNFRRGEVAQVGYVRKDRRAFTPKECLALLQIHAPATEWNLRAEVQAPGETRLECPRFIAICYQDSGMLMVCTREYSDAMLAKASR